MSPFRMSKAESAMRLALAFKEAFNRQDVAGMIALMSEDCIFENSGPAPDGAVYTGKEGIAGFWQEFFRASPNAQLQGEELFGFGKRCLLRWRRSWDEANGDQGHVRGIDVFTERDGAICEQLSYIKG